MQTHDLERWATGLRLTAKRGLEDAVFAHRAGDRSTWTPFLRWKGLLPANGSEIPEAPDPDARLWWVVAEPGAAVPSREITATTDGPLFEQGVFNAIEVWTESELSALQALWWLGQRDLIYRDRARAAALWHIENTQPDNATNRPWAIPVFLEIAIRDASPDARLYAETLLHNAIATNGVPEPFSAAILLDAAEAVESMRERG